MDSNQELRDIKTRLKNSVIISPKDGGKIYKCFFCPKIFREMINAQRHILSRKKCQNEEKNVSKDDLETVIKSASTENKMKNKNILDVTQKMSDCKPLNMVFDSDSETNESQENSFSSDLNFEPQLTKSKATSSSPTVKESLKSNVVPLDHQKISLDWEDDFEQDNILIIQEKKKQPLKKKKDFDKKQRTQWKTSQAFQKYRLKNQIWFRKPKIISDFENGRACPAINEFVSLLNSEDTRIDVSFNVGKYVFIILFMCI